MKTPTSNYFKHPIATLKVSMAYFPLIKSVYNMKKSVYTQNNKYDQIAKESLESAIKIVEKNYLIIDPERVPELQETKEKL